jgi:hypothetical protein
MARGVIMINVYFTWIQLLQVNVANGTTMFLSGQNCDVLRVRNSILGPPLLGAA